MSLSKLFEPITVGANEVQHRIVHAPLTRLRCDAEHVPLPMVEEYYEQRSRTPGTLIIGEATIIAPKAGGLPCGPGIYNEAQIASWKKVTDAIHRNKSFIYLQLWASGRAASVDALKAESPDYDYVSASDVPVPSDSGDSPKPRPLTHAEVKEYVGLYVHAAECAIKAGFDGVEIHGASGYLIDQFTQDVTNHRTDEYGGSIENRSRFALEVTEAIVKAIGEEKTAMRLSPWSRFLGMKMDDPIPQFTHLVTELRDRFPKLAYLHLIEPRICGFDEIEVPDSESNDFIRKLWADAGRPLITAGGYDRTSALELADKRPFELLGFGRLFLSNPDLPYRYKHDIPAKKGDRSTYYTAGKAEGYIDYQFAPLVKN